MLSVPPWTKLHQLCYNENVENISTNQIHPDFLRRVETTLDLHSSPRTSRSNVNALRTTSLLFPFYVLSNGAIVWTREHSLLPVIEFNLIQYLHSVSFTLNECLMHLFYDYVKTCSVVKQKLCTLSSHSLKAHAVLAKVGYPEFILNDTFLNEDIKQVCSKGTTWDIRKLFFLPLFVAFPHFHVTQPVNGTSSDSWAENASDVFERKIIEHWVISLKSQELLESRQ